MLDPNLELSEEKKNLLTATTSTTLCSTDYTDRGDLTWYNLCVCVYPERGANTSISHRRS